MPEEIREPLVPTCRPVPPPAAPIQIPSTAFPNEPNIGENEVQTTTQPEPVHQIVQPDTRSSGRTRRPPAYLNDYDRS